MLAFFSRSSATNLSLADASGSSRMRAQLREVGGPQVVRDVVHRLGGQRAQRLRLDLEERPPVGLEGGDALGGHQPVRGGVLAQGEQIGVRELWHYGHSSLGRRRLASIGSALTSVERGAGAVREVRLSAAGRRPADGDGRGRRGPSRDLSRLGTLVAWTSQKQPQQPGQLRAAVAAPPGDPARLRRRPRPHRRHPARGAGRGPARPPRSTPSGSTGSTAPRPWVNSSRWSATCPRRRGATAPRSGAAARRVRPRAARRTRREPRRGLQQLRPARAAGGWAAARTPSRSSAASRSTSPRRSSSSGRSSSTRSSIFGTVEIRVPENVSLRGSGDGVLGNFEVRHAGLGRPGSARGRRRRLRRPRQRRGEAQARQARSADLLDRFSARPSTSCASTSTADGVNAGA